MIRLLRRLLRRDLCACGHTRADHWIPFTYGRPCTLCSCEGFR